LLHSEETEWTMPNAKITAPYLRLAATDGQQLVAPFPAIDAPETTLVVSFAGLTEAEQRAALAGFPGGRRFRLAIERKREAS
jgi:hypothetical protein